MKSPKEFPPNNTGVGSKVKRKATTPRGEGIRPAGASQRSGDATALSVAVSAEPVVSPSSPPVPTPSSGGKFRVRAGQREFEMGVRRHRIAGLLARRQFGKTTIASRIALRKMMGTPGHTVIFGSVKLDLGREIVRKEAEAVQRAIALLEGAAGPNALFQVVDGQNGKDAAPLRAEDFAELYEAQRLEFRLYHSRTVYSRTKVVALTTAAVGETGDLILDEVGRVKNFREVWEAVKPIIASNPGFKCVLTTTPPPDDAHYSFELLAPPIGVEMPVSPIGNWYRSELGVHVLRISAYDAAADGVPMYDDDTGNPISPAESRAQDSDKDAWDRNYGVQFVLGGTAAVGLLQIDAAQRRGIGECVCVVVQDDVDFGRGLAWIREKLGSNRVGVGFDIATTEAQTSNPSSVTVMEERGADLVAVATIVWKTREPLIARDRLRRILEAIEFRGEGLRARRLAIDASNEVYFATELQQEFCEYCPVELVKGGVTIEVPGQEPQTTKAYLGNQLVGAFDDNRITTAPERYIKTDMRLVRRDRGSFQTELGTNGEHGDTFDSHKLALHALKSTGGAMESVDGIHLGHRGSFGDRTFRRRRLS